MRSIKLDVPKAPGQKRYNAGLESRGVWCVLAGWAAACLAHSKNRAIRVAR